MAQVAAPIQKLCKENDCWLHDIGNKLFTILKRLVWLNMCYLQVVLFTICYEIVIIIIIIFIVFICLHLYEIITVILCLDCTGAGGWVVCFC